MSRVSIGAIGWRNHAARVIDAVNAFSNAEVARVYHPSYVPSVPGGTSSFEELLAMDGVMVLSPNDTHVSYIERLRDAGFYGPILCEKPPATDISGLHRLSRLGGDNIIFDFSLRHSDLVPQLHEMLPKVGEVIVANICVTHGLAFKQSYPSSWRADGSRHHLGLLETVSIHWIDLLVSLFGPCLSISNVQRNVAKTGTASDTSIVSIRHSSNVLTNIVASYAAPARMTLDIVGTQGIIKFDGLVGWLELYGPRDVFNGDGSFRKPDINKGVAIDSPFEEGMMNVVGSFIDQCRSRDGFPPKWFDDSIETTRSILECTTVEI